MLRKYALFVGVAALGALVTSCGGDDSGEPTPTPTPTETPTPTPTAAIDFDLAGEFETTSANANYTFAFFTADGSTVTTFNGASRLNGTASITYDSSPDSVTFGFPDLSSTVSFAGTDLVSGTATRREYANGERGLVLELPFDHVLRTSYTLSQAFTRDSTAGTLQANRVSIFFNNVTTDTEITTDLAYTGNIQVTGGDPGSTVKGTISAPQTTLTVDASEDAVVGTLQIFENVNGTQTLIATLPIDADINANGTFAGTLEDAATDLVGNFAGAISGPNREELFILFSVSGDTDVDATDDRRYVGSFIGKR